VIQTSDGREGVSDLGFGGIEIGAVSVKWVYRESESRIVSEIRSHEGNPRQAVRLLFSDHADYPFHAVCTGQASRALLDLPYRSETECFEKAIACLDLSPDILLSLGGESFSVYPVKSGTIRNIISSSKCAAGTGEFVVQQFSRMGMAFPEDIEVCERGRLIELATRCSVHCKSDATHKLNKGECDREDVAFTLIHDLAVKVRELIESAQWPMGSILLAGGVSRNRIFVQHLRELLPESTVAVVPESPYLEAYGAFLYARELRELPAIPDLPNRIDESPNLFDRLPPLKSAESYLDFRVAKTDPSQIESDQTYILGVDAGSTTTKAVLLNAETGDVDASCYLRTLGNPISATKSCLRDLLRQMEGIPSNANLAATTGSGREMVSVFLGNCPNFNEILAHARASVEEVPDVDTVFEIGGQDSKFISFLNGIPIDYAINDCILLGDLFEEARNALTIAAQDSPSALQDFDRAFDRFAEYLKVSTDPLDQLLTSWVEKMKRIPLAREVGSVTKVLIIGGLNLMFVHQPVSAYLLEQRIVPKVVDVADGACWVESEDTIRLGFKSGYMTPDEQFAFKPARDDRASALKIRKSRLGVKMIESRLLRFRAVMGETGLLFDRHHRYADIISAGHPYASGNSFTETTATVGRFILSSKDGIYSGFINLGAFNCQPAMNAQAILRFLSGRNDQPYIAIDCEGPWLSTSQRRLLETLSVRAKRHRA